MTNPIRKAITALERGTQFAMHDIWMIGRPGEEVPEGFIIKQIRVVILLVTNLADGSVLLRASALTFATILSIVPMLAVMFYVIQTFNLGEGLYDKLQSRMEKTISQASDYIPKFENEEVAVEEDQESFQSEGLEAEATVLDEGAAEEAIDPDAESPDAIAEVSADENDVLIEGEDLPELSPEELAQLRQERNRALQNRMLQSLFQGVGSSESEDYIDPVERLSALANEAAKSRGGVTIAGILLLFTTVFGLMRNIEKSFNGIWGVRRTRSWYRMMSDYVMITLLLPFVAAAVLGATAALQSEAILESLGPLAYFVRGIQYFTIVFIFSTLYFVVPNTRVRPRYALLGGVVAGLLWVLLSWSYVQFQIGVTRYNLVFSTFAQFPVLLMWIYVSWIILLFGAELSYAYQNEKTFAMERLASGASYAYREAIGLRAMVELGRRFVKGQHGLDPAIAAGEWNVPSRLVDETLQHLEAANLVVACATDPVTYQPARPLEKISTAEILSALREVGEDPSLFRQDEEYRRIFDALDNTQVVFQGATLDTLLDQVRPAGEANEHPADQDRPDFRIL